VEVRLIAGLVEVRDGKDRAGSVLAFTRGEWQHFLLALKKDAL